MLIFSNVLLFSKSIINAYKSKMSRVSHYYAKNYEQTKIDENVILYETRDGQSIVDSPLAIFLQICQEKELNNFQHVWVVDGKDETIKSSIPDKYLSRVTFVVRNTKKYIDYLLIAKYLVNNATFQSFFVKKKNQIYINTWHGTPLKYMGFDIPGDPRHSQNVVRNLLMSNYFLSPNRYTTDIFVNSYKLDEIYPGTIIETGYPRIDFTYQSNLNSLVKLLKKYNVILETEKPVVLYTPTWKGTSIQNPVTNIEQTVKEVLYLKERINKTHQLLVKVHPYVYPYIKNNLQVKDMLVPNNCDANQILGGTDILITDYSSIFFDYLVTDRPIVFYAWDKDIYEVERGMYLEEKDFPGPIAETIEEVGDILQNIEKYKEEYQESYRIAKQRFVNYDNGEVAKRIIDYIFFNKNIDNGRLLNVDSTKRKLVIYPGNLLNNGITTSFLNLMNNIDFHYYDVTVFVEPTGEEGMDNLLKINSNVRFLFKPGIPLYTIIEDYQNRKIQESGLPQNKHELYPEQAFKREANRLLANLNFDVSIDFSGYSYFWAKLLLGANAKKHIIYQHNDLWSDSKKVINGKMPHEKTLRALFSIYFKFDRILSVSPMTMKINEENLKDYIKKEQIGYSVNTINSDLILNKTTQAKHDEHDESSSPKRVQLTLQSKENRVHTFFKNVSAIYQRDENSQFLSSENLISAVAKIEIGKKTYYKCLVDQKYVGWTDKENLIELGNEIFIIKEVNMIATVLNVKNRFVWRELKTVYQTNRVTPVDYLFNTYVFIDKKAETLKGTFYHIISNKKNIGWIESNALARFHQVSFFSPLKIYCQKQNRKKRIQTAQNYEIVDKDVTIKEEVFDQIKIWKNPPETTLTKEASLSVDVNEVYTSVAEMTVCNILFSHLEDPAGQTIGWIETQYIVEIFSKKRAVQLAVSQDSLTKESILDDNRFNFVTMGRLSPEKNHQSLIEAFALFTKEIPNARLYILGEGVLDDELRKMITDLEMEETIYLMGYISEPFRFIEKNDVFVLSSIYEGQPMVLLEAMTLGMKILATNIPANINVIGDEEYGFLTGTDVDELYKGLLRIYNFKGNFKHFDYEAYNKNAVRKFYEEIKVD